VKNAAGASDNKSATVEVDAHPPVGLTYPSSTLLAFVGVPLSAQIPSLSGGDGVQAFSVSPALPAGLALDPSSGVLSGTPTASSTAAVYQISATNSGGSATFNLDLTVDAQPPATFSAGSATIGLGGGTTLAYTVDATVDSITVDNGVQTVPLDTTTVKSGAFPISPSATTTYTLTANLNGGGTYSPAPVTVTVDTTPFAINTFTTTAPQNVVPFGGSATVSWTLTGTPAALTLNGASVLGSLSATVNPIRRKLYTLTGDNGLSAENTSTKTLTVAAQGLDLLAGHYSGPGYKDAQGALAQFNSPFASAADAAGNLYIADSGSHVIRMIDTSGNVTTIAGVVGTTGTTDSSVGTALFNTPRGIAVTPDGQTVYVADYGNHAIRKLAKTGGSWTVSTFAGTIGTYGTNDGVGTAAQFDNPCGLCFDPTGQYLFVADYYQGLIRQIELSTATVITYAGSSFGHLDVSNGYLGSAKFDDPVALCFGTVGGQQAIFVVDYFINCIRAVTYNGPATVKATSSAGMTGSVYSIAGPASGVTSGTFGYADGTGTAAKFNNPYGIAIDASGNLYVADSFNNCIRKVVVPTLGNGTGVVTTVAGSAAAPGGQDSTTGTLAGFKNPQGATLSGSALVVADSGNGTLRKVDLSGGTYSTSTLAGTARVLGYAEGTLAAAQFNSPVGVASDASGNILVADTANHVIRKVDVNGTTALVAGTPGTSGNSNTAGAVTFKSPQGVAVDKATGVIYVADTGNKALRMIATDGTVSTLVSAGLSGPYGIAVDPSTAGLIWVADSSNKVFPVTISGGVGTLGSAVGSTSGYADGAAGTAKFKLNGFSALAVDASGNVYVADRGNSCIRKLTKASAYAVSTVAGLGSATAPATNYGFLDGGLGANKLNFPQGLDIDAAGNLYVADNANHAIRKIDTSGTVTTLVGANSSLYNANGAPRLVGDTLGALPASLYAPQALTVTPSGDLVVTTNDGLLQVTAPNGQ
jgi:sugar lactone lactonase YvrE